MRKKPKKNGQAPDPIYLTSKAKKDSHGKRYRDYMNLFREHGALSINDINARMGNYLSQTDLGGLRCKILKMEEAGLLTKVGDRPHKWALDKINYTHALEQCIVRYGGEGFNTEKPRQFNAKLKNMGEAEKQAIKKGYLAVSGDREAEREFLGKFAIEHGRGSITFLSNLLGVSYGKVNNGMKALVGNPASFKRGG